MKVNKVVKEFIKVANKELEFIYPAIYRESAEFHVLLYVSNPYPEFIMMDRGMKSIITTHNMETMDNMSIYEFEGKYYHCESQYDKPVFVTRSIYDLQESISQKLENFKNYKIVSN